MESGEEEDLSMDTQPETGLLDIGWRSGPTKYRRALAEIGGDEPRQSKRARLESVVAHAGPPSKRVSAPVWLPEWPTYYVILKIS